MNRGGVGGRGWEPGPSCYPLERKFLSILSIGFTGYPVRIALSNI